MAEWTEVVLTAHARQRMVERNIDFLWLQMTIDRPDDRQAERGRETRWRLWRRVPEKGDRALCVVLDERNERLEVVTVFFDRRKRL